MLKHWILSVLLLTPTVGAQEEALIVERALRISVVGTIVDTPRELHLTRDQEAKITSLRTHHYTVYSEAVRASYDGVPGQKVTGDLLEIASRVTDEERQHLRELRANYESNLKSVLTPKQYTIAEGLLLRERLHHGGIEAVVRSTDVSLVADLKVSATRTKVRSEIQRIQEKLADADQDPNARPRVRSRADFCEMAAKQRRDLHTVLKRLGANDDALRRLMEHL